MKAKSLYLIEKWSGNRSNRVQLLVKSRLLWNRESRYPSRYAAAPLEATLVGSERVPSTVTSLYGAFAANAAQTAARAG